MASLRARPKFVMAFPRSIRRRTSGGMPGFRQTVFPMVPIFRPLAGMGGWLLLGFLPAQVASADGLAEPASAAPTYREEWLSDGYWLDEHAAPRSLPYRSDTAYPSFYTQPSYPPQAEGGAPWGEDYSGFGSPTRGYSGDQPDLRPVYSAYGQSSFSGGQPFPFSGVGFRPMENNQESGAFVPHRVQQQGLVRYSEPGFGENGYGFRPDTAPEKSDTGSPVWYRERASGRRYLFRPVSEEELRARPSDHSFTNPRFAIPEFGGRGYGPQGKYGPSTADLYRQQEWRYWGGDAYGVGSPVNGFD